MKVTINVELNSEYCDVVTSNIVDWPYDVLPSKGDFIDYRIEELVGDFVYEKDEDKIDFQGGDIYQYKEKKFTHINNEPVIELWFVNEI